MFVSQKIPFIVFSKATEMQLQDASPLVQQTIIESRELGISASGGNGHVEALVRFRHCQLRRQSASASLFETTLGPGGAFLPAYPACDPVADMGLIILQPDQPDGSLRTCTTQSFGHNTRLVRRSMVSAIQHVLIFSSLGLAGFRV